MEEYNCKDITLQSMLIKSKGNFLQIKNFLNHNEGNDRFADKILMLSALMDKDYTDITEAIRESQIADMLENLKIDNFKLYDDLGKAVMASDITRGSKNIIVWIEEGKEPTEHILNEMIQSKEIFNNISSQIIFIIKGKASLLNATLSKTLQVIPNIQVYYDDFKENVPSLARRLYVDPDKLPLIIVTNKGLNTIYTFSGYNVGIADLICKIVKLDSTK